MKTLTEQYRLIKEDKGHKGVFLKEAKKQFPNLIRNAATFKEASTILKQKGIISENYVDLQPINNPIERKKESYETAFANFLAEAEAKAEEKKVSKEVEEDAEKNYDYEDKKDPNNMIFGQIQMGYYCEYKDPKNEGKTDQELLEIVYKNLAKDPIYYTKNGQFGEQDLGYTDDAPSLGPTEEPKGPHKSSGYGKLKENKELKEEVSLDDFLKNQLTGIEGKTEGMETVEREEWLDMFGGTKNESGFDDIYNLIKKGKNSHSIDFGDFKANYALKTGDDKIIIKYKVKKDLAENKLLKENINEHSISMAGGIVTGGGFSHMNYMDYFGLNEDENTKENTKDVEDLTAAMKELGDVKKEVGLEEDDVNEMEAPMHIEKLMDAAEIAYDAGMDVDEILGMIEQHLGLKMGDF